MEHRKFAGEVFSLFAAQATEQHLKETVVRGSTTSGGEEGTRWFDAYASAPSVTSLRLVNSPQLQGGGGGQGAQFEFDMKRFAAHLDSAGFATNDMHRYGLPECVIVQRNTVSGVASSSANNPSLQFVVVDAACGEAVLRGSDVFAPGILASTKQYNVGDEVAVVAAVGNGAPLKGSFVEDAKALVSSCVVVGYGIMAMNRTAVISGQRGVAIKLRNSPHPPQSLLDSAVEAAVERKECESAVPIAFLQNWTSMVPIALLRLPPHGCCSSSLMNTPAETPSTPYRILDMCSAPGGKASHILSKMRQSHSAVSDFQLVCCERSATRAKQLEALLKQHHGSEFVEKHVIVYRGDSNKLPRERALFGSGAGKTSSKEAPTPSLSAEAAIPLFDRILLDPPCTGFGLRPRLRPHAHSVQDIVGSADYQRKLISTAVRLLKPGGTLVYSTCTISFEENEGTVQFALAEHPELSLCQAETVDEERLLGLSSPSRLWPPEATTSSETHTASRALLFRFEPGCCPLDTVGFFAVAFKKTQATTAQPLPSE